MAQEAETTTEEAPEATPEPAVEPEATTEETTAGDNGQFSANYVEKLRRENAKHRSELREAQERLKEIEDAEKSELEKLQERAEAAETASAEVLRIANEKLVRAAVVAEAAMQGAVDPDAVVALLASDAVEVSDDGEVEGAKAAVQALLEEKTYLAGASKPSPGPGGGGVRTSPETVSAEQVRELAKSDPAKFNEMFEAGQIPGSALGASGSRMP